MSLPALKDLFARHRTKATGLWRLGQEPQRTVFLEGGDIVFAASTHPLDRLTHLLVERGKLTQAQLDYAMANLNPAMSIGKNLIEMGFITQRDLLDVARSQVERVVWAGMAETADAPAFEAKELESTTVRLPFDTPAVLLGGVLNLKDRERLLDELGPLNQVVVLEGRRHQELTLPADLVRIPGLLDGSRTLLELSRESGVEPFRLGAFVLFLREMGWARLHELPPLDRRALELALDPPPQAISPALPEAPPTPPASLFAEIHASQHPTTNLEHLSEALDRLGPEDELEDPFPPEAGLLTGPLFGGAEEFPLAPALTPPVEPPPPAELAVPIQHEAEGTAEIPDAPDPEPSRPSRWPWLLVAIALVAVGLGMGVRWYRHRPAHEPLEAIPAPVQPPQEERKAEPAPTAAEPPPSTQAPAPVPAPAVESKPEPPAPASNQERLQAIVEGKWKAALAQGAAHRELVRGKWSLRLEIACQESTVQHAVGLLKNLDPDVFLVPIAMRDGRTCYQLFFGAYGSEAAARAAAKRLPAPFRAEGNRPKPFRVNQIPDRQ
ncbi:DUF4388 domain-containing protein [Geothrix sp. 21YS21S-4]|uniref:DUF4388 domain-containing protein n=1 Tax=Geothrix sp. 21YS21S-4 TaxID=3068889 RepID=UPI0027BAE42B|nr:hypothetical protein [Geothrix sp. 21YS21S-4]